MDEKQDCAELLQELFKDPVQFYEAGRAYALLQVFFSGESVHTLKPLLRSTVPFIQRAGIFVASELGAMRSCGVLR